MEHLYTCLCEHPRKAWILGEGPSPTDGLPTKRLTFNALDAKGYFLSIGQPDLFEANQIDLPCGKCVLCSKRKKADWAVRLVHELATAGDAAFITLTYNPDSLPTTQRVPVAFSDKGYLRGSKTIDALDYVPTLRKSDLQLFVKRLRRRLDYHLGKHIRFFACGEYGSRTRRPHYHLIVFGWRPDDLKVHHYVGRKPILISPLINDLWPYGFTSVDKVHPNMCRYVAGYVAKKYYSKHKLSPLAAFQDDEFILRSCRSDTPGVPGGIGGLWLSAYRDTLLRGFVNYGGKDSPVYKASIPPYYMTALRRIDPKLWLKIKRIPRTPSRHSAEDLLRYALCARIDLEQNSQKELL